MKSLFQNKQLASNVWKFYVYKGFWGLSMGLLIPVVVLFYLERGISLAGFMALMAVLNITTLVMEVPGGVIADKFSRKWSVCAGTCFKVLSLCLMVTPMPYPVLVLAFACWGLGESLVSGADSALLYDSLQAEEQADRFPQIIGKAISLGMAATVAGTLLCSLAITYGGLVGPFWVAIGAVLLTTIVTAQFKEPPFLEDARASTASASSPTHYRNTVREQAIDYVQHLRASFRDILENRQLLALIFVNVIFLRAIFLTERPFSQPQLTEFGYSASQISLFFTGFYLTTTVFALFSDRIAQVIGGKERSVITLIGLLGIAALVILANAWSSSIVVVALIGFYVMRGLLEPFMQTCLNRRVSSEQRASCLSIANMGGNVLAITLGPIFGYFADVFSLPTSLLIFQWLFVPLFVIGIAWSWRIFGPPTTLASKPAVVSEALG